MKYEPEFLNEFGIAVLEGLNAIRAECSAKYPFGHYRSTDAAAEYLRSRLPERFQKMPLDMVRLSVHANSGKVNPLPSSNGKTKAVTPSERMSRIAKSQEKKLSPEFIAYENGDLWKARAQKHREFANWHCQVCGKQHWKAATLHVHHNIYGPLDGNEPVHTLIAVCADPCHPICDVLRQSQASGVNIEEEDLFSLIDSKRTCPHGEEPSECNACMVESDIAYDSAREDRIFGR